jgi:hypothetical protein
MKIRTAEQVSDALSKDLIWRRKELTALRFLIESTRQPDENHSLLRASVALLYAHWEGFIKNAALIYLEFVRLQRLKNKDLAANFVAISVRSKLKAAQASDGIASHLAVTKFFLSEMEDRGNIPNTISTKSNLSSLVLKEIVLALGLDFSFFEPKAILIDEKLVGTRNTIAHGEHVLISRSDYEAVYHQILSMLDHFRTQVENAVAMKRFSSNPILR